jgi:T5SS/PEP-CTERM-associated repeat protein
MDDRPVSSHGVLVAMRSHCRTWLARALVAGLACLWPLTAAEAVITATGDVSPPGLGPGNTVVNTIVLVGNNGVGSLAVNGGNVLTSTAPPPTGFILGGNGVNLTTGQGAVTIDGAGSKIENEGLLFTVGRFGTASAGGLSITNGGRLSTNGLNVGVGDGAGANGSTGGVLVDGAQNGTPSSITISGANSTGGAGGGTFGADQGQASVTLSHGARMDLTAAGATSGGPGFTVGTRGGTGSFSLLSGAVMTLDGSGMTGGTGPGFTLGSGGTGTLTVDDASIEIAANQFGGGFTIGTANGVGTATFENGASVLITGSTGGNGFNVGRSTAASQGTLTIRSGATVTLNSTAASGGFTIGDAGTGTVTLSGHGTAVVQNGLNSNATPGNTIGNQAGSSGTLTITDGATWTLNRSSAGCCMTVGRLGHGNLHITGGGKLIFNDNSPAGGGAIVFGGNNTVATGGTFDALISGPGSTLTLAGINTSITLGRNSDSSGTMTVEAGAAVNVDTLIVGRAGSATLNVLGSGTTVNLVADAVGPGGGGFGVGANATGSMTVSNGAVVNVDRSAGVTSGGVFVGGSQTFGGGGNGSLTVSGAGSKIGMVGSTARLRVGIDPSAGTAPSTGTVVIASGGEVVLDATAAASVGASPGSTGTLTVTGAGSLLDAGAFLGIGRDFDDTPGGTGTVIVAAEGTVKATDIHIGTGGTLAGSGGTVIGNVTNLGGTVAPGSSPGQLTIAGNYQSLGGTLRVDVDASGSHDRLTVIGAANFDAVSRVDIRLDPAFQPPASATFVAVQAGQAGGVPQPLLTVTVAAGGGAATTGGPLAALPTTVQVAAVAGQAGMVAAVLPSGRSVRVGRTATAFVTVQNTGPVAANLVGIAPATAVGAQFSFQTTDPATNALTGLPDVPVSIPAGQLQTFVIALTPTAAFGPTEVGFAYAGTNTVPVTPLVGINTLLLSASDGPVPDIVALAATVGNTGIVTVPNVGGTGFFAVATVNVGEGSLITAAPNFGGASLPGALFICQTNPGTGQCLDPPAGQVSAQIDAGQTPTFAIFVQASGAIPLDPAANRVFVEFRDPGGAVRGKTSVAVQTQ